MKNVILILAALLCGPMLWAQESTFRLDVLGYQWTTTHRAVTFSWAGHANTSCSGSAYVNGYISGAGNFSANGTGYSTCSTTFTPPANQTIDIQKPVVFILADTENSRMVLTCTRDVRWSQCHALNPGTFLARNNNGHFEVQAPAGNKEEWVKFDIIQRAAISRLQPQTTNPVPEGQRAHFAQLDGKSGELNRAAEAGVVEAQMYLGYAYAMGNGVPKDLTTALAWYKKAYNNPNLAFNQRDWVGPQIRDVEAQLAKSSPPIPAPAAQSAPSSPVQASANTESIPTAQSIATFKEQAANGDASAQYNVGSLYAQGEGVPQDYAQAAAWYRKAAEQSDPEAEFALGDLYEDGHGVPQDYALAAVWYRKAADQGYTVAQLDLGVLYQKGRGVPQDYAEAYFWLDIAAVGKVPRFMPDANTRFQEGAAKTRDEAAARLTPADLSRVQERARKWFEDHPAKPQ